MSDVLEELTMGSVPRLCAYGFALTGSQPAAAELVQAAVTSVMARTRRPSGRAATEVAVLGQMRRLHLDGERRIARWVRRDIGIRPRSRRQESFAPLGAGAPPQGSGVADGGTPAMRAWETLPPRVRTALAFSLIEGLSDERIAHELHMSQSVVADVLQSTRDGVAKSLGIEAPQGAEVTVKVARR